MESSFLELKCKQIINVIDGKNLGHIIDIVFDLKSGRIKGLVVPSQDRGLFSMFKNCKDIFIPFHCICKIGADVILVEIITSPPPPPPPGGGGCPNLCRPKMASNGVNNPTIALNNVDYSVE